MPIDEVPMQPLCRLQVAIAHAGYCSRRHAEQLITAGKVSVNGQTVTQLGFKVNASDVIGVDGKTLGNEIRYHYLALHKPAGYLSAASDQYGRPLAVDLFKPEITERIYNIGRLDLQSSGLLLFTNDGAFAAKVAHPSSEIIKEYQVQTDYPVPSEFCTRFQSGIMDAGELLKAESVKLSDPCHLLVKLREGKNREIRRALASFDLRVRLLHRLSIGPVVLGNLAAGTWRRLTSAEIAELSKLFCPPIE